MCISQALQMPSPAADAQVYTSHDSRDTMQVVFSPSISDALP